MEKKYYCVSYPLDNYLIIETPDKVLYYYDEQIQDSDGNAHMRNLHWGKDITFVASNTDDAIKKHKNIIDCETTKALIDMFYCDYISQNTEKAILRELRKEFGPTQLVMTARYLAAIAIGVLIGWTIWG